MGKRTTLTIVVMLCCCLSIMAQQQAEGKQPSIAIKTNLAGLAAGVANVGMEWRFAKQYSLHFPVRYSPYTISNDYRLRMLTFQPEVRYWFTEAFHRHFVGLHPISAFLNVSIHSDTRYQTNRMAWGFGASYGYSMNLSKNKRWKLELGIGLGYANADYDCYYNVHNGIFYDTGHKDYWGITHASVNLVYLFKRRNGR